MFLSILKYCFSFLLALMAAMPAWSQLQPQQQQEIPEDTVVDREVKERVPLKSFIPTGLRIGSDIISDIRGYRSANFNGWEVSGDVDFYRYYLTMEYGQWGISKKINNGAYANDGKYWRLGIDINFLKKDPDRNMFFLGARYGRSVFDDNVSYTFKDVNFGDIEKTLINTGLTGSWFELTTGLRVKIWKFIWMGYTGRLKIIPRIHGEGELKSYDLPGYGLAATKNYWGFNYQLFFRIPVRKSE